jgi:predicted adenine nucleotide alpha hydrolase (AANH) superfamily ATPase
MNKEKVVDYINKLQNYDSGKIAKIATEHNLYKKTYITCFYSTLQTTHRTKRRLLVISTSSKAMILETFLTDYSLDKEKVVGYINKLQSYNSGNILYRLLTRQREGCWLYQQAPKP